MHWQLLTLPLHREVYLTMQIDYTMLLGSAMAQSESLIDFATYENGNIRVNTYESISINVVT